jgi:hypothetical protein
MTTSSKKSSGVDIVEVGRRIGKDAELLKGLKQVDLALLKDSTAAFEQAFRRLWAFEHANDAVSAKACKDLCFAATTVALRHIDSTGVSRAVGRLSSHFSDFSYERNLAAMAFDHMYLVQTLGVPEAKALQFWRHVDAHRARVIKTMSRDGFAFEPLVARAVRGFESEGEPWQHMSPGLWTKLGGGALAAVNIAGAVGAITGVGAVVAIASGLAGVAAILAG